MALKLKKSQHFPCQANCLSHFSNTARTIKDKLNKRQLEMFRKTKVGRLLDMDVVFNGPLIHNVLLREVKDNGEESENETKKKNERKRRKDHQTSISFLLGGMVVTFSRAEFEAITGLDSDNENNSEMMSHRLRRKYFDNKIKVSGADIERIFIGMNEATDKDLVNVGLVYFVEMALMGKEKKTMIDTNLLSLVDDLKQFDHHPWGDILFERTLKGLKTGNFVHRYAQYKSKVVTNPRHVEKYAICGFPFAFQVWLYEIVPKIGRLYASHGNNDFHPQFGRLYASIGNNDVRPKILQWKCKRSPTTDELERYIFNDKELVVNRTLVLQQDERLARDTLLGLEKSQVLFKKLRTENPSGGREETSIRTSGPQRDEIIRLKEFVLQRLSSLEEEVHKIRNILISCSSNQSKKPCDN